MIRRYSGFSLRVIGFVEGVSLRIFLGFITRKVVFENVDEGENFVFILKIRKVVFLGNN